MASAPIRVPEMTASSSSNPPSGDLQHDGPVTLLQTGRNHGQVEASG